jgi:UDP-glucuronate 4-epimerase
MAVRENSSVLVTGGRGFVGRAVGELLRRAGYNVVSVDRTKPVGADAGSERDVVCNIADAAQLQRVFEGERIREIIHLAAILPTVAQREPLRTTQVNVEGSLNLLECARKFGVRRFVFGSSVSVYGTGAMDQMVSEGDRAAPEDLYGAAKLYVEQLGRAYRDCHGLDFVSLRIARVVGPGAQSVTSAWRSQIFEFLGTKVAAEITVPYVGSERVLVAHVDDVARMLLTLLEAPRPSHAVYNAPCESLVVSDLKKEVEGLNPHIRVTLGERPVFGNPRLLDCRRFQEEFDFQASQLCERLRQQGENERNG